MNKRLKFYLTQLATTPKESSKCTTANLIAATYILSELYDPSRITAIQFEDGSGTRFNFITGNGSWQYIDLAKQK